MGYINLEGHTHKTRDISGYRPNYKGFVKNLHPRYLKIRGK